MDDVEAYLSPGHSGEVILLDCDQYFLKQTPTVNGELLCSVLACHMEAIMSVYISTSMLH